MYAANVAVEAKRLLRMKDDEVKYITFYEKRFHFPGTKISKSSARKYFEPTTPPWRFRAAGYHHQSLRNLAIVYHLDHPSGWSGQEENLKLYSRKRDLNQYVCKNGLEKKESFGELV